MTKFTVKYLENLPLPETGQKVHSEQGGLYLKVYPSGNKVFYYVYSLQGKQWWLKLGKFPQLSLQDARKARDTHATEVATNINPAEERSRKTREHLSSPTVKELGQVFLDEWSKPRKKSWKEDERQLKVYVYPVWGNRKAKSITRQDVRQLLKDITTRGPIQSNRVFALIRKMFGFAVMEDILEESPCYHVKPVGIENRKDRVLTEDEIRAFWQGLDSSGMSDDIRRLLRLILVTAQRPGEIVCATWSELDGDWWTIPADRSKNNLAHRVYLPQFAQSFQGERGEGYIFPSPKEGKHIHVNALSKAVRRNQEHFDFDSFTPHDLRRTAASHMTADGVARLTVSKILNHAEPGVTATYDRHSYDKDKRQALEKWARKLKLIVEGAKEEKVVTLR